MSTRGENRCSNRKPPEQKGEEGNRQLQGKPKTGTDLKGGIVAMSTEQEKPKHFAGKGGKRRNKTVSEGGGGVWVGKSGGDGKG